MTQSTPQPDNDQRPSVADAVMQRINTERVTPKPWWYFVCVDCSVWTLWALSILFGAIAIAVVVHISTHMGNAFYEATHTTFVEFAFEAMPILWLLVFGSMSVLAYVNLRHTRKGYRYSVWQIMLSSVVLSILGGSVLHVFGFGHTVEMALEKNMPMYKSYQALEREWWLRPGDGLLVGQFEQYEESPMVAHFKDINDTYWQLQVDELPAREQLLLESQKLVKVIGVKSTSSPYLFHGCGVFPWMHERAMSLSDMQKEKGQFLRKINTYKKKIKARLRHQQRSADATTLVALSDEGMGACAMMPVLRRP